MTKQRNLLIAEDEEMLRDVYIELCSSLSANIIVAKNGEESLNILRTQTIHAVLSDINMPKMTGIEVLKEIRQAGKSIPYLILSGYGDSQNIKAALQFGATNFLDKPCDENVLLATVDRYLDLGIALQESEDAINDFFRDSTFAPEKVRAYKEAQQAINILRFDNAYRLKQSA